MIEAERVDRRRRGADDLERPAPLPRRATTTDISSLRIGHVGGSAVPAGADAGLRRSATASTIIQAWGMTETSPLGVGWRVPPARASPGRGALALPRPRRAGSLCGVEARIVGAGRQPSSPWDGESVGELEVRGPWITGAYYYNGTEPQAELDAREVPRRLAAHRRRRLADARRLPHAHRPGQGRHQVGRRVDLLGRPRERADGAPRRRSRPRVVGVPDEKWGERPLASRGRARPGSTSTPRSCASSSPSRVAHWQVPERWAFIDEVPKTSVGKFDKKVLRSRYAEGELEVRHAG